MDNHRARPPDSITNDVVDYIADVVAFSDEVECFLGYSNHPSDERCPSESERCEGEHYRIAREEVKHSTLKREPLVGLFDCVLNLFHSQNPFSFRYPRYSWLFPFSHTYQVILQGQALMYFQSQWTKHCADFLLPFQNLPSYPTNSSISLSVSS